MSRDLVIRIRAESGNAAAEVRRITGELSRMEQSTARAAAAAQSATASLSRMGHAATALFAANVSVSGLVRAADAWNSLNAQLKIATGSARDGAAAYAEVVRIAGGTGQALEQVGTVYRRFAENAGALGLSLQAVAGISETVAKAMSLSGGSAASAEAALVQLGQALASGVLRGEEFNSVMEQAPRLARALADGMGLPIGKLREMAQEGKITSEVIANALQSQQERIADEFAKLPLTVANAMQNLRTAWVDGVGSIEGTTGVFKGMAAGIDTVAKNMDVLIAAGVAFSAVMGGKLVASLVAAAQAKVADVAASVQSARASATAAAASQAFAAAKLAEARAAVAAASGMQRLALVQSQLIPAQRALAAATAASTAALGAASVAATAGARALALVGGPIGLVTTALALGGAAWLAWGNDADAALKKVAASAQENIQSAINKIQSLNVTIGSATRKQVESAIQEGYDKLADNARAQAQLRAELAKFNNLGDTSMWSRKQVLAATELENQLNQLRQGEIKLQKELIDLRDQAGKAGESAINSFVSANAVGVEKIKKQRAELQAEYDQMMTAAGGFNPNNAKHVEALATLNAKLADLDKSGEKGAGGVRKVDTAMKELAREIERQRAIMSAWATESVGDAAKHASGLAETTARLQGQLATMGMSAEALARYNATKLDAAAAAEAHAAAELEAAAAILTAQNALPEVARAYRQMAVERRRAAEELQRQSKLTMDVSAGEAVIEQQRATEDAARAAADEWQRTADQISQSLTDALMRGFEDGAGFAENFKDTLINMFKTLVLRPVIQAMVQPVAGAMAGIMGGGGGVSGSAGGTLNMLSGAQSIYGAVSGGLVSGVSGAIGSLGSALGSTALTTFSAGMKGATLGAGMMGPTTAGAGGLMGAGSMFATALPWLAGGLAIASLLGAFDKKPSNKAAGGTVDLGSGELSRWEMQGDKAPSDKTKQARDVLLESIFGIAESVKKAGGEIDLSQIKIDIGERDGFQVDFGKGMESLGRDAEAALNTVAERLIQEGYAEFDTEMRAIVDSLEGESLKALQVMSIARDGIVQIVDPIKQLGDSQAKLFGQFADLGVTMPISVEAMNAFAASLDLTDAAAQDTAIGMQALAPAFVEMQTAMDALYASMLSPTETLAKSSADLTQVYADLGVEMPKGVSGLRALIDAQDQSTEAGATLRAQLLTTAPAMAELEDALLSFAGISGDQIATTLRDAMLGRISGDDAGGQIAQLVLDGIYSAVAGGFAQSITDIMVSQIITPVIQAAVTGSSISAAVSQGAISNMIAAANAAASALNAILSDAGFQAAMQSITAGIAGTVNAATSGSARYRPTQTTATNSGSSSKAAADRARDAWDAAYAALSRAADVQRDLAQEQLDTATAVLDIARSAANELLGISDVAVEASAQSGNQTISDALLALRNTGYLPDPEALQSAVDAARNGIDRTSYGSAVDQQRDALTLAGKLSEIADLTEPQKTAAEQQIAYLDSLLDTAKAQLDAYKGGAAATVSLADAIRKWTSTTGKTLPQFSTGGFTGPGGKLEPAGVVHKGEVVWSQSDIARAGGVAVVEAMRKGLPGYADGGVADVVPMPMAGSNSQDDLVREVRALRKEVELLRAASEATARHTQRIAKTQDRVTRNGEAMQVEEVAP